jgi:hypothetical protein
VGRVTAFEADALADFVAHATVRTLIYLMSAALLGAAIGFALRSIV